MPNKVLIVDNEPTISNFIKKIIEFDKTYNLSADLAININQFKTLISKNKYSIILIDLNFQGINVFDFISQYTLKEPLTLIITTSATIDVNTAITSMRSGAYDFIAKPFTSETLLLVIKNALEKRQLLIDKEALNKDIQSMNEELSKANEIITKQKEEIDKHLKELVMGLEKIKLFSESLSKVQSFESSIDNIFNAILKVHNPISCAVFAYDEKLNKFIVKHEKNFSSEFPVGIQMEFKIFKKYFDKPISPQVQEDEKNITIIVPLIVGKVKLGLIIFHISREKAPKTKELFSQIMQHLISFSLITSKLLEDSKKSYIQSLMAFLILEEKIHKGIKKHCEIVTAYSIKVGKKMEIPEHEIRQLQYASLLHLLGLTILPERFFTAENYFNDKTGNRIKNAIISGAQILEPLDFLHETKLIIENIFENYSEIGIPGKLKGKEIPITSRILRVVGEFFVFKNIFKMDLTDIETYFLKHSGKLYDSDIVRILFDIIKKH